MTTALGDAVIRLPERARDADRIVTGGREVEVTLQPWGKRFGAAVDIGTTTLAMYLYDLASGEQLSTAARRNPAGGVWGGRDLPAGEITRRRAAGAGGLHPAGACRNACRMLRGTGNDD